MSDRFDRLLRWYPASWRTANGDVLLGILRDHAEHEGRAAPTRREMISAAVNGTALRLDARVALCSAVAALVLTAGSWLLTLLGFGASWVGLVTVGLAPMLTLLGLIALLRSRGGITAPRALAVLGVLTAALVLAALTQLSWGLGFQLADTNHPMWGLAAVLTGLFVAAWIVGGAGIALLLEGLLHRTRLPRIGRVTLAVVAGAIAAPIVGLGLLTPTVSGLAAAGVAVTSARALGRGRDAASDRDTAPKGQDASTPVDVTAAPRLAAPGSTATGTRSVSLSRTDSATAIVWLGSLSAIGGAVGIAYVFTGSRWAPAAVDGTAAMGQAISILLVAGIPLLAALGLAARRNRPGAVVWPPLGLAVLAVFSVAMAYTQGPAWDGMAPWMTAAPVLLAVAAAWWTTPHLRGPFAARLAVGIAIGVAFGALLGLTILPTLSFAVPVLGVVVAVRALRRGPRQRRSIPQPSADA